MKNRRRAKANHGAAELAVVGLIGAGSAITLGRGYLAERRSKALDVELVRALQPWSFDPSVRLSPPEDAGNFSPRLRDLADPNALTPAFDARKRQLLAQAASRDIHVGADRRGVLYLGLPGQPPVEVEFSRRFRKRNGATRQRERPVQWRPSGAEHPRREEARLGYFVLDVEPASNVMRRCGDGTWERSTGRRGWVASVDDGLADPSVPGIFPSADAAKAEAVRIARATLAVRPDRERGEPGYLLSALRKRNDATSAVSGLTAAEPWAFAQYDDPIFGSWGVAIEPDGADLYRFDGAAWRPAGRASWNAKRGRLEHASAPDAVIAGLNRAALASPHANEALRQYLRSVIGTAFTGNRSDLPTLTNGADTVFRAVARARCSDAKATKSRPGTKAAESALAARDHDLAVAKVALREVCGRGMKPIAPGTPCEVALDALRAAGPETPCAIGAPPCPHRVSEELFSAWRSGAFPSIGPYETDKPHTMGDDPCCYYHPQTQARLRLRREVEKTIAAPIGSQEWVNAIKAAELSAPSDLVAAWHKCDDAMTRRVDPLSAVTGAGVGSSGNFLLLQAFYRAAKRNDEDRMAETYAALRRAFGHLPDLETLAELDSNFWDLAIQEARDSGNLGFKRWVQSHGGKSGRTVFRRFDTASGTLR